MKVRNKKEGVLKMQELVWTFFGYSPKKSKNHKTPEVQSRYSPIIFVEPDLDYHREVTKEVIKKNKEALTVLRDR